MVISGVIEHIIYKNADNGYTVLEIECADENIVTVGIMPLVAEGEQIEVEGDFMTHQTYGKQFVVSSFTSRLPVGETAILKYLSSSIIKGVGIKTARLIVDRFGPETLDIIENDPSRLTVIKGISPAKAKMINKSMLENIGVKSILLYFQQYGITPTVAFKLYKQWGLHAYDILKSNPYCLCDIPGVGFEKADDVAAKMDYDPNSKHRIEAGITYIMNYNLYNSGHTFLPYEKLCQISAQLLECDIDIVYDNVCFLVAGETLAYVNKIGNTDGVFLSWVRNYEMEIMVRIMSAIKFTHNYVGNFSQDIENAEKELGIKFASKQKEAIQSACCNQIMILTGGPGTGKTTTLNGIINIFEHKNISFAIAAPTGRAAKRITELTNHEAKTIHRLLEYRIEDGVYKFGKNSDNPLLYSAVIIDESSMMDLPLFAHLLEAVLFSSKIILVGDSAQLPPVGPGRVFKDMIDSGVVPVTELDEIFRQAQSSLIVTNAHRILNGNMPDISSKTGDFFMLRADSPESLLQTVKSLYIQRLPDAYGYDPISDIQVLSPTKKGVSGTVELNKILGEALNPPDESKSELSFRGTVFRVGDKVMQTKNDYDVVAENDNGETDSNIFNGDIGIIESISEHDDTISVRYDDRKVIYSPEMLEELEHAYAITVHKSQGSEFKAVILTLCEGSDLLFTRNLLYTAVTRAKELLIIVGYPYRVSQMVQNTRSNKRYSGLKNLLIEAKGKDIKETGKIEKRKIEKEKM